MFGLLRVFDINFITYIDLTLIRPCRVSFCVSVHTGYYVRHLTFYKEINLPTKSINNQFSTKLIILKISKSGHQV